jgi:tetrapyrrole methylase family protein / MazG family protein
VSARRLCVTVIAAEHADNLPDIPVVYRYGRPHASNNRSRTLETLSSDSDFWTVDWQHNLLDVLEQTSDDNQVGYVVPGHPMLGDATVQSLLSADSNGQIEIELYDEPLPVVLTELLSSLNGPPAFIDALTLLDRARKEPFESVSVPFSTSQSVVISSVCPSRSATQFADILGQWYRNSTEIRMIPMTGELEQHVLSLDQLREESSSHPYYLVLPPAEYDTFQRTSDDLKRLVARLRAPGGCPWDREQTNQSLGKNLIEESYELLDAIEREDHRAIREELGDFLLQAFMHAQILHESRNVSLEDVIGTLINKLVRRHPHVFATASAADASAVVQTWDEIKREEKKARGRSAESSALGDIPASLPALLRLQSVLKRAGRSGLGDNQIQTAVETAISACEDSDERDLIMGLIEHANTAREAGVDLEHSLRAWTRRYEESINQALSASETAD